MQERHQSAGETKAAAGGTKQGASGGEDTIKLASASALTGGSAEQGTMQQRGMLLAIKEANEAGGIDGRMIEQVAMDDRGDPKEAATVANSIASDENILAVIGHTGSSSTLAGTGIYESAGMLRRND